MINRLINIFKDNKDKIAYINGNDQITYGELLNKAIYYADILKRQGNEPIAIYGHKSLSMLIGIVSSLIAKRAYVILDISIPLERCEKIIKLTCASLVIKTEAIDDFSVPTRYLEDLKEYQNLKIKENKNTTAYIIFTSGSTGEPKGVPISYDNLINFINWISSIFDTSNHLQVLNTANFNFDLSVADIFYSIYNGHTIHTFNKLDYYEVFNLIININMVVCTPSFIRLCLLNKEFNDKNYHQLKYIYSCGEKLDVKLAKTILERFPEVKLFNAYGPTEATSAVCGIFINKSMLNDKILPVGLISNAATKITIENNEIVLKGDSVFDGYLNLQKNNCYKENGINVYKTGDVGYIKNDMLYLTGRLDNQIKYRGYRIELEEIENVLNEIDGVDCAIVVPIRDNEGIIKNLKCYVEGKANKENILVFLKKKLPDYMIPKTFVFLDKIPINENGKIDRKRMMANDRCL